MKKAAIRYGAVLGVLALSCLAQGSAQTLDELRGGFLHPPDNAKPMVRWWWFGPAVVQPELARELDAMHAAGIGGVELAADYPLALDDPAHQLVNLRYASPEYAAMVHFAEDHARSLGMRVDLTLGSGWPFGGPEVSLADAAGKLKIVAVPLGSADAKLPQPVEGDSFIAAFVADGTPAHYDAEHARQLPGSTMPSALESATDKLQVELFFFASHTRQQVKRAAFGGEGYVLDHLSKAAVDHYLNTVGSALLQGFPDKPPYAIFSDSLEVYGADWSATLPEEFRRWRGYDLVPNLPLLAQGDTPRAAAIRRDWGQTLADMVRDNYLATVAQYAAQHGTRFRSQTYGTPGVTLFDEHVPQLPEGEGPQWRDFSYTRWASSANHIFGNNVTSAETFTWLHSPAFRATPLDMKVEADRMFLEGVNQIIEHGYPYSAPGAEEPGWSLYAAAALNDHNPWWPVMPEVARYLARVSWLLRQGEPANDVAILLPEADAQADFRPGHVSVTDGMEHRITPALMGAVLDAGYNLDYLDLASADAKGIRYPVVVVPPTERMPLHGVELLRAYAAKGGKLIFIGETPTRAAGLSDEKDDAKVEQEAAALVKASVHIEDASQLPDALEKTVPPDVSLGETAGKLGFLHRHLPFADVYFLANTSNQPVHWSLKVRAHRSAAEWWDVESGNVTSAVTDADVVFPPYASRVLVLHDGPAVHAAPVANPAAPGRVAALGPWTMTFPGSAGSKPEPAEEPQTDTLWTDSAATRFYSGEVVYRAQVHVDEGEAHNVVSVDFAPSTPLEDTQPPNKPGIRAWIDPPVHEAAIVFVNGKRAGALWHPPYALALTGLLRSGENTIELHVYNTAINELAGQPPRDYTELKAKYGDRFQMQDMNNLEPVPSGIRGPVRLVFGEQNGGAQ
ncbi:glycosyl hydrolase [Silvibacterium sp.]|uniref:glycosyl hydrolase n=1 Tax=Silvibacterium sp. TaxID=1964179 RepID=UPI0039E5B269